MNRSFYFKESSGLSFRLLKKGVKNANLRLAWPKGSAVLWKKEFKRLTKLDKKKPKKDPRRIKIAPFPKIGVPPKIKTGEALKKAIQRKLGKIAAKAAAERGLKRRKLWNVHIVANYDFGRSNQQSIEQVDMQFSTRAFTKMEVRNKIDELRIAYESEEAQGILNGKSNWTFVSYVSIDIVEVTKSNLANVPMLGTRWHYKLLGDLDKINIDKGKCVPDYLLHEFSLHKKYFKYMNEKRIIRLLGGEKKGYTVNDIIELAKTSKYISVHALSPMLEVFSHYTAEEHTRINLCFIVNNDHCYPILDSTFKKQIIYKNKLELGDFTFDIIYDDHSYYSTESEFMRADRTVHPREQRSVCLVDTHNLFNLAHRVMSETGNIIQGMKFYYSKLIRFEHPDGTIVEVAPDYHLRKEVCEIDKSTFTNQTWTSVARDIYTYKFNDMTKSVLSQQMIEIYKTYPVGPYIKRVNEDTESDSDIYGGFDKCKSYSQVLLENEDPYPIFTPFDDIREFDGNWTAGEYYIKKTFYLAGGTIKLDKGFYPLNITRSCVKKGYISMSDIKYHNKSMMHLSPDHFKKFVEYCFSIGVSKNDIGKSLVNHFIGYLNKKFHIKEKGCITDSYKMACGTFAEELKNGKECFINKVKDLYVIRSTQKEELTETCSPIWRHIICGGIMNLDDMYHKVTDENSVVISYKVDAIFVKNPRKDFEPANEDSKKIGDIVSEQWSVFGTSISIDTRPKFELKRLEWNRLEYDHSDAAFEELKIGSYAVIGMSGSCKSYTLSKLYKDTPKVKVLCFTNKAVDILKQKGVKDVQTFNSIFWDREKQKLVPRLIKGYDEIWVDEFPMTPWKHLSMLLKFKQNGGVIRLFGDPDQTPPVEDISPERAVLYDEESGENYTDKTSYRLYDYMQSDLIKYLCGDVIHGKTVCRYYNMKYVAKYGRYDDSLFKVVRLLSDEGVLHKMCKNKKIKSCWKNIAYTNKKCCEINKLKFDLWKKKTKHKSIEYTIKKTKSNKDKWNLYCWQSPDASGSIEHVCKWIKGMPVICNINSVKHKVNRGEQYVIEKIGNKIKLFGREPMDIREFSYAFSSGYCITVHRMQGDEIIEPYNIHEIEKMSRNLAYTAIGRGREFKNVNFEYTDKYFSKDQLYTESILLKSEPKAYVEKEKIEKKETVVQIVQDVHINKKKYAISEQKNMYMIMWKEDGKKKNKKVRWGRCTKEEAYKKILKIQEDLLE